MSIQRSKEGLQLLTPASRSRCGLIWQTKLAFLLSTLGSWSSLAKGSFLNSCRASVGRDAIALMLRLPVLRWDTELFYASPRGITKLSDLMQGVQLVLLYCPKYILRAKRLKKKKKAGYKTNRRYLIFSFVLILACGNLECHQSDFCVVDKNRK